MNNGLVLLAGVAGAGVLGAAVYLGTRKLPAEQKVGALAPGAKGVAAPNVPTHTNQPGVEQQNATLLQMLASYEADLRRAQSLADSSQARMRSIEQAAQGGACESYAQNIAWKYNCNGFPVCGINEWWTVERTERNNAAYAQCQSYVKGLGGLSSRSLERKGDPSRHQQIMDEIGAGYTQATDLRQQYQTAKRDYDNAMQQVEDLKKRISDLNARGVY